MKKLLIPVVMLMIALGLSSCTSDADTVSENLSKAAENFEVERRIVVFNGITDKYLMVVEGRCSIEDDDNRLDIICKLGDDQFIKNYAGLSDNVSYWVEQSTAIDVSEYHYRVTFKPQSILPDPDFRGSTEDTPLSPENQQ